MLYYCKHNRLFKKTSVSINRQKLSQSVMDENIMFNFKSIICLCVQFYCLVLNLQCTFNKAVTHCSYHAMCALTKRDALKFIMPGGLHGSCPWIVDDVIGVILRKESQLKLC